MVWGCLSGCRCNSRACKLRAELQHLHICTVGLKSFQVQVQQSHLRPSMKRNKSSNSSLRREPPAWYVIASLDVGLAVTLATWYEGSITAATVAWEKKHLHDMRLLFCMQVQQSRLQAGEERQLRAELRQLDARRASVDRAGLVHQAVTGDRPLTPLVTH